MQDNNTSFQMFFQSDQFDDKVKDIMLYITDASTDKKR